MEFVPNLNHSFMHSVATFSKNVWTQHIAKQYKEHISDYPF